MVLALGAALTLIAVLLFGRVFWSMAMAAGARKRAKAVPMEMLALQADRDRLRAEHAMMARKLELRVDDIKTRMAEQMAEVSRNRNRVQNLAQDMERKDESIAGKDREITSLNTQLEVARAELAAAHQTIDNLSDETRRQEQEKLHLQDSLRKLGTTLREKNALVGGLNEELRASLPEEWRPPAEAVAAPATVETVIDIDARLRERVARLTSISHDISREHEQVPAPDFNETTAPPAFTAQALNRKVAETERLSSEMEQELHNLDQLLATSFSEPKPTTEPAKKQGAMANVVSLAQRIRALQRAMND